MRYKIQLINALGKVVDESAEPLQAAEAIRLIQAYESVITKAAQQGVQSDECPALIYGRHDFRIKDNSEICAHCGTRR